MHKFRRLRDGQPFSQPFFQEFFSSQRWTCPEIGRSRAKGQGRTPRRQRRGAGWPATRGGDRNQIRPALDWACAPQSRKKTLPPGARCRRRSARRSAPPAFPGVAGSWRPSATVRQVLSSSTPCAPNVQAAAGGDLEAPRSRAISWKMLRSEGGNASRHRKRQPLAWPVP